MNENGRSFRINWADIISKILFLIVFVLILMWFFPNNANNSNNNNDDESILEKYNFSVLFDKIFRDNLNEMKYAAKSYFTVERMPDEGEEVTLTLQDMYDKNLLLPLIDKDNKACDAEKSFVKVTKDGKEYKMKITLTCGDESKTITEIIGCYDFCEDDTCNNGTVTRGSIATKLQYQFVREIESTKYTCPSGYTLKGKYCYTIEFGDRIEATEIISEEKTIVEDAKKNDGQENKVCTDIIKKQEDTTYTCPEGYTLNGTTCSKTVYTEPTIETGITCPEGYEKNGNYCYKTQVESAIPTYTYTCPTGTVKNDLICTKTSTVNMTQKLTGYKCPSGCTKSNSSGSKCTTTTTKNAKKVTKVSGYSCPSGYTRSGTKCTKKVFSGYSYGSWKVAGSYSYTSKKSTYSNTTSKLVYTGTTVKKSCSSCRPVTYYHYTKYTRSKTAKYTTKTVSATKKYKTTYSCSGIGGTLSGTKCKIKTTKSCTPQYKNVCTTGTAVNGKCQITTKFNATKTVKSYMCYDGYTLNGKTCTKSEVIPGTPSEGEKTCPEGYKMEGDKCSKTETISATEVPGKITYSCPEGYKPEPDNSACCKTEYIEGDYYCENENAVLEGNKCIVTIPGGDVIGYKCPSGYTKTPDGKHCYRKVTKKITATSKTVVSYQYKWSYLKSIPGWTRTGKTRSA